MYIIYGGTTIIIRTIVNKKFVIGYPIVTNGSDVLSNLTSPSPIDIARLISDAQPTRCFLKIVGLRIINGSKPPDMATMTLYTCGKLVAVQ